jgi:CHAT domain-containing protein
LPFDLKRAHELYAAIFGEIETFIGSKQLLVVPSFVLARFPLHALVIRPPASDGPEAYREAAWFGKRNAISVLPAVSSLKALRRNAKASRAGNLYIGFGNPLLDGPDQRYAASAQLAREKAACPPAPLRVAAVRIDRRAAPMVSDKDRMDPNNLRTLFSPLPETADELCDVARTLGVPTGDIFLGSAANERGIKAMSRSGKLTNYQILHFATHGALGGQVKVGVEPGLILTPPAAPSEEDDGYLSASEIAALKLDADLVILSACNTASGSQVLLESLTGMAQSFLYAGARALLVSYWEVNSAATVKLITKTVAVLANDKSATKSDALRQAMMSLVEAGDLADAHPAIWAPFVVVGEAAR